MLIGFISSFLGGLIGLLLLGTVFGPAFGLALILPGLVPHFFTGGAAGVYGNATGGRRGAICGAFVNGLLVTFLPAVLMKVLGSFGDANTTFGDADFGWFGLLIGYASEPGLVLGTFLIALICLALLGSAILVQKKVTDKAWDPAPARGQAPATSAEPVAQKHAFAKLAPPAGAPKPPAPLA